MRARLAWLVAWSAAFGLAEAAVVVYLRRLCYPEAPLDGPLFPLRVVEPLLLRTELLREAATLVMLLGLACLAERRPLRRFAAFAFAFGAWDLAYYAALWQLLGWPASLLEWDLLFLVPAPWAAPVLAPALVALALVGCGTLVLVRPEDAPAPLRARDWWVLSGGGALILASFLWHAGPVDRGELPGAFPWWLFLAGWLGGLLWCAWRWRAR